MAQPKKTNSKPSTSPSFNEKDAKLWTEYLKQQTKGEKASLTIQEDINKAKQDELSFADQLASKETEILSLINKKKQASKDLSDYTSLYNDLVKGASKETLAQNKDLAKQIIIGKQKAKQLNDQLQGEFKLLKIGKAYFEQSVKEAKLKQESLESLSEATDKAAELTEKYEELFEPLEEIDTWMKSMPGGGLMSKALGLDGIGKKIEHQVVKRLAEGQVAGKGLVASLGPLLPLLIAVGLLAKAFEFDKELTQFAKDMDLSKDSALGLSIEADHIAGSLGLAGVTGKEVQASMAALKEEFGTAAMVADQDLVGAVTTLRERVGLTNEEALSLNSTATMLGTNLNDLAASSYDMADGLIGGKQMLKEMSKLPKSLVAGFKGTTQQLQKAIVKGKLFGLTIEQAAKAGESMLDIESSIEKEMTANVLTGKHMNLNRARQLALTGSQAELQDEILKQAGSLEDYQKMSPLQQKAMSDALGLSSEEMANMLTKSEEMRKVGLDSVKVENILQGSLEEQQKTLDGMAEGEQKAFLQKLVNGKKQEEATAKFQTSLAKMMEALSKVMLPIVEGVGFILDILGFVIDKISHGVELFNHWYHSLTAIVDPITGVKEELKEGDGIMGKLVKGALAVGAAIWLWSKGMKLVGKMKSMDFKSMIPGMGGGSKTPKTPDTSKMDKAKGKGSEGGLTSLAGGLKAMGQSGVGKGIFNTALAGPALLFSLPSIPFLAFIGKVKLDKLEENFTGLGNGLKAMDGTLKGSLATGAFGIAGALALASIPFLLVFGKVKLDKLQENFIALGTGLQSMSGTMMGSAGLGAFALAGALAIPSLIFLGVFGKVTFGSLIPNFTGLAEGLMLMSPTLLGSAALAAFGLAALIAIPSLIFLGGIALLGAVASAGLIALGTGLASLGAVAATGLPFIAVGLIAALGLAMIPFGIALAESAPGLRAFADILSAVGPIITATFEGIGTVIEKISGGIALIITTITQSIQGLANLDPAKLLGVAGGIIAVGAAIAGFGAGAGAGGIMSAIGSFFDEDPVEKFNRFAAIDSSKLLAVAAAIAALGENIGSFGTAINIGQLDSVGEAIDRIGTSIENFGAKAAGGGLMAGLTSFFDEDPVEKFNRFAAIDSSKLIQVSESIKLLGENIGSFGTGINIGQLDSVSKAIDTIGTSIENFGAKMASGGIMSAIGSFFDEDPVEKFNIFAAIDSSKLLTVAGAITSLASAFSVFSSSISSIGDTSGITSTIDKVMELHDAMSESPIEEAVNSVASGIGSIFDAATSWVSSIMPDLESVGTAPSAGGGGAAAPKEATLTEVTGLLKELIAKVDQPVQIKIGGRVVDEMEKQTSLRKTYNTKMDSGYGTFG